MTEVGDGSDTVEPFTVIRLGKALGGKESPASLFGSQHRESLGPFVMFTTDFLR